MQSAFSCHKNTTIGVLSRGHRYLAFDARSMQHISTFELDIAAFGDGAAVSGSNMLWFGAGLRQHRVVAVDILSAKQLWTTEFDTEINYIKSDDKGRRLFVGCCRDILYVIDMRNGELIDRQDRVSRIWSDNSGMASVLVRESNIELWAAKHRWIIGEAVVDQDTVQCVCFSPSEALISMRDGAVIKYQMCDGTRQVIRKGAGNHVVDISWNVQALTWNVLVSDDGTATGRLAKLQSESGDIMPYCVNHPDGLEYFSGEWFGNGQYFMCLPGLLYDINNDRWFA